MRALALLALAACADDGGGGKLPMPDDWPGAVSWAWSFSDGGTCPDGVTTANIYLASYDVQMDLPVRIEPRIMISVPCAAGAASFVLSNPLGVQRLGRDTWVELATADGRVFARSQLANTRTKVADHAAVIAVPRGWLHAAWTIARETTGEPAALACELYETAANDIVLQPSATDCARGEAWLAFPPGTYDLALGAFDGLAFLALDLPNDNLLDKVPLGAHTVTAGATTELGAHALTF